MSEQIESRVDSTVEVDNFFLDLIHLESFDLHDIFLEIIAELDCLIYSTEYCCILKFHEDRLKVGFNCTIRSSC